LPLDPLPIDPVLPAIVDALVRDTAVVIRAPTGAGKTTRVPPALLDAGLAGAGRILLLQPRRLATCAAARRIAAERGGAVGDEVGFQVRFERRYGPGTRILAVTPGILLRHLLDDPYLEKDTVVVFDEFHERGLESDLALGTVRLIQQTVRPEVRIVVMSATLAVEEISAYLGGCPVIVSEGRLHPVSIEHQPRPEHRNLPAAIAHTVEGLLDRTPGDILVFLPGLHEIRQAAHHLEPLAEMRGLAVLPLHGELPLEQQDAALRRSQHRKVVLATNVAETSVTVEGVTAVVDSGLVRLLIFDPAVGLDRLRLVPISRASADQRTGRAGRTAPGICIRLWSASAERGLREQTPPEVRRIDVAGSLLTLLALGEKDIRRFPWFEPPPEAAIGRALELLERLGATDKGDLTDPGKLLSRLPVHPRLGRLLVAGHALGDPERAALAAALLSERDPFVRTLEEVPDRRPGRTTASDVLERVEALEAFEAAGTVHSPLGSLNRAAARFVLRARDQLARTLRQELGRAPGTGEASPDDALLRALFVAFPDRLARRREPGSRRGVMVGGRGVRLAPSSGAMASELFVCIDVDAGQGETVVRQASAVERDWLPEEQVSRSVEVVFDERSERVSAVRRTRFEDLVLDETACSLQDGEETARILAAAAVERLERVLPPGESPAGLYRTRVRCLRQWMPELGLPAWDEADLREVVTTLCHNRRSFEELRQAPWLAVLQGQLTHQQRQAVEREAPERLAVPSGSHIALRYEEGRPPILAVRIQELFGLRQTPRIAAGRVAVLLHLLGPNYRPQQVTDDLASFWENTYPQVRKDLRARYPRHAWPEDPYTALAERRPGKKRSRG
jgi:ATP-dependent helicase HrpB